MVGECRGQERRRADEGEKRSAYMFIFITLQLQFQAP